MEKFENEPEIRGINRALDDISELEQQIKELQQTIKEKKEIINAFASDILTRKVDKEDVKEIAKLRYRSGFKKRVIDESEIVGLINLLYWQIPEVKSQTMEIVTGLSNYQVRTIAGPGEFEVECSKCKSTIIGKFKSRTEAQSKKYSWRICQECEQERWSQNKESEMLRLKREAIQRTSLEEFKTMPYYDYLQTPEWQKTRNRALRRANYRCQVCNGNENLHVHHRTYVNRGNEKPEDLIVLCKDCHQIYHFHEKIDEDNAKWIR